jgi:hypothetical protein
MTVGIGCTTNIGSVGPHIRLADGSEAVSAAPAAEWSALLVYTPSMALSCASAWERWRTLSKQGLIVRMVLTKSPKPDDAAIFRQRRIPGDLAAWTWNSDQLQGEYLLHQGRVIAQTTNPQEFGLTSKVLAVAEASGVP